MQEKSKAERSRAPFYGIGPCRSCGDEDVALEDGICVMYCLDGSKAYREEQRGDFLLFPHTSHGAQKTMICNGCGGDQFIVGGSDYHTCIKCPMCGWERTIHDG